ISSSSDRLFGAYASRRGTNVDNENVHVGVIRVNMMRRSEREAELSFSERLQSAVYRSKRRVRKIEAFLKQQVTKSKSIQLDAETPVQVGDGEFLMKVAVGTPPVSFEAIVDTGSDLI
ncbi:hypothetical protein KI387_019777, partial [Taxus chinensis]